MSDAELGRPQLEALLRAGFADVAGRVPATTDPWPRATAAIARSRRRRRTAAAVTLVAAIAVVAGAVLVPGSRRTAEPAEREPVVTDGYFPAWSTRGDLAGRADLLVQVRQRAGGTDVRSVPFLGEVAGEDVALAVRFREASPELVVLHGPHGSSPLRWTEGQGSIDTSGAPVLAGAFGASDAAVGDRVGDGESVRLVLVTQSSGVPGLEYSPHPTFGPDGVQRRAFTPLELKNGVAAGVIPGQSVALAVHRATAGTADMLVYQAPTVSHTAAVDHGLITRGSARCDLAQVDELVRSLVAFARLTLADVESIDVRGCLIAGDASSLAVGVQIRGGPALVDLVLREQFSADSGSVIAGNRPVPGGQGAEYPLVVALTPDAAVTANPSIGPRPTVLAFSAPGGASAELWQRSTTRRLFGPVALDARGSAMVTLPRAVGWADGLSDVDLVVRDAQGRQLRRVPAEPHEPWGPDGNGPIGR